MGEAYSAKCTKCDYQEDDLMDGCGMAMQTYVIVECGKCQRLSSKYLGELGRCFDETLIQNKRCSHCRCGSLQLYEVPENDTGKCPCCVKQSLTFTETMLALLRFDE